MINIKRKISGNIEIQLSLMVFYDILDGASHFWPHFQAKMQRN